PLQLRRAGGGAQGAPLPAGGAGPRDVLLEDAPQDRGRTGLEKHRAPEVGDTAADGHALQHAVRAFAAAKAEAAAGGGGGALAVDDAGSSAAAAADSDRPATEAHVPVTRAGVDAVGEQNCVAAGRGVDGGLDGALGTVRGSADGADAAPGVVAAGGDVERGLGGGREAGAQYGDDGRTERDP